MPENGRRDQVLELRDFYLELARRPLAESIPIIARELEQILRWAVEHSPYWRAQLENVHVQDGATLAQILEALPTMSPRDLQDHFEELRIWLPETTDADYLIHTTSGSTGTPRRVAKHLESYLIESEALVLLEWAWQRWDVEKRIVFFRANVPDQDRFNPGPPITYLGTPPDSFVRMSTKRTAAELLDEVETLRPSYLFCNGVMIRLMAIEQLRIPRDTGALEYFLSASDRVDPSLRELVREAFSASIADRYSSEEFGFIAIQCPDFDHMHVAAGSVIVEIVDEHGVECRPGVPGRVLVTSLHGFAMPLIRYEIGDFAEWGEQCPSGITWPVIERIHGRSRQQLTDDQGRQRLVTLVGADFLTMREILDFQIVLFENALVFIYRSSEPLSELARARIARSLGQVFYSSPPVNFVRAERDGWQSSWKRQEIYVVDRDFSDQWRFDELLEVLRSELSSKQKSNNEFGPGDT